MALDTLKTYGKWGIPQTSKLSGEQNKHDLRFTKVIERITLKQNQ